jgi:hypothetical protein
MWGTCKLKTKLFKNMPLLKVSKTKQIKHVNKSRYTITTYNIIDSKSHVLIILLRKKYVLTLCLKLLVFINLYILSFVLCIVWRLILSLELLHQMTPRKFCSLSQF